MLRKAVALSGKAPLRLFQVVDCLRKTIQVVIACSSQVPRLTEHHTAVLRHLTG